MKEMASKEADRLCSEQTQASVAEVAEDAFSDIFHAGFELLQGSLSKNSYVFIKHILTEMAHNEALDD